MNRARAPVVAPTTVTSAAPSVVSPGLLYNTVVVGSIGALNVSTTPLGVAVTLLTPNVDCTVCVTTLELLAALVPSVV